MAAVLPREEIDVGIFQEVQGTLRLLQSQSLQTLRHQEHLLDLMHEVKSGITQTRPAGHDNPGGWLSIFRQHGTPDALAAVDTEEVTLGDLMQESVGINLRDVDGSSWGDIFDNVPSPTSCQVSPSPLQGESRLLEGVWKKFGEQVFELGAFDGSPPQKPLSPEEFREVTFQASHSSWALDLDVLRNSQPHDPSYDHQKCLTLSEATSVESAIKPCDRRVSRESKRTSLTKLAEETAVEALNIRFVDADYGGAFGSISAKAYLNRYSDLSETEDHYKKRGIAQAIARHEGFQAISLFVIVLNGLYIGVEVDANEAERMYDSNLLFIVAENFFCLWYVLEVLIRGMAFRSIWDCFRDSAFRFDFALVVLMVGETWIFDPCLYFVVKDDFSSNFPTPLLRLFRLVRLGRVARLIQAMPELVTMMKGIFMASRAVTSSLVLVCALTYVFGIIMHMLVSDVAEVREDYFGTLPLCMWTLLVYGVLQDEIGQVLNALLDVGTLGSSVAVGVFLFFTLLSAVTVLNMLIGVLCEVVHEVRTGEKEEHFLNVMQKTILVELYKRDTGSGFISQSELLSVLSDPDLKEVLKQLNVDVAYIVELQYLFNHRPSDEKCIDVASVVELLLLFRGDQPATVRSMVIGQAYTRWALAQELSEHQQTLGRNVEALCAAILGPSSSWSMARRGENRSAPKVT
uniref:Ion transport domain-containing protein n=1 Tax=Noctiluca scintillans TaxID=2966 RepID=A0A7S1AZ54_NOCSC